LSTATTLLADLSQAGHSQRGPVPCRKLGSFALLFAFAWFSSAYRLAKSPPAFGTYCETLNVSLTLAQTGQFANPFTAAATGPTAHVAPLYPLFLAGLMKLFGLGAGLLLAVDLSILVVFSLHAALLPAVSGLLFGVRLPGICAGAAAAVLPLFRISSNDNSVPLGVGLMLFLLASEKAVKEFGSLRGGMVSGCLGGLLLLLNPQAVIVVLIWASRLAFFRVPGRRKRIGFACALLSGLVLTCTPWTVRNYRTLGSLIFVRDNLGLELAMSNHDLAAPTQLGNLRNGSMSKMHPNFDRRQANLVAERGEVQYNRDLLAAAAMWCVHKPGPFLRLTLARIWMFWFPMPMPGGYESSLRFVTALSFIGWIAAVQRKERDSWTLGAILLLYPAVYYVTQADPRYRYPIVWVSLLLAGYIANGAVNSPVIRSLWNRRKSLVGQ
jgi:hypothetical protein